jgi:hypothetical protein
MGDLDCRDKYVMKPDQTTSDGEGLFLSLVGKYLPIS